MLTPNLDLIYLGIVDLFLFPDPLLLEMTVDDIDSKTTVLAARVEALDARLQAVESNQQMILQKLSFLEQFMIPQQWYPYEESQHQSYPPITSTSHLPLFSTPFTPPPPHSVLATPTVCSYHS